MKVTKKNINAFKKVRQAERSDILGGISLNDSYNISQFGIDRETYLSMKEALVSNYGPFGNSPERLTPKDFK